MRRLWILVVALVVGAAAPARAWCEASCTAPSTDQGAHCSTHEPSDDAPSMAANEIADCPVIESARPAIAKIAFGPAVSNAPWHAVRIELRAALHKDARTLIPRHPGAVIPLRI